jgi:hypothetical protein
MLPPDRAEKPRIRRHDDDTCSLRFDMLAIRLAPAHGIHIGAGIRSRAASLENPVPRTRTPSAPVPVVLFAALVTLAGGSARAVTRLDCDRPGTPYEASQLGVPPGPTCVPGGPTGNFLRLADTTVASINAIAFDLTDPGAHGQIVADFDFRMTPHAFDSRADGFGFTLASTAVFDVSGPVPSHSEEPDVTGSLGIGFDIHQGPGEVSADHVSIHWNGGQTAEIDVSRVLDLASGQFTHARLIVRPGASPPDLTLLLTPHGSLPVTVVDRLPVPGLYPYESRVHLMARSGGEAALHDIDNLNVQFMDLGQGLVSLGAASYEAIEGTDREAVVTVTRFGGTQGIATVHYTTADRTALAGVDYTPVSGTLTFGSGETTKSIRIPILDDPLAEGDERFQLTLADPAGALLGGPDQAWVTIVDDESARAAGRWSGVKCWPFVAIHGQVLADGRVMLWPRGEAGSPGDYARVWDPATDEITPVAHAGFNIFCGGHSLTADGAVFVAGGHVHESVGLSRASFYDPAHDIWTEQPDMNAARWYPTTTVLPGGDLLVTAGSIDTLTMNEVPQVLPAGGGAWRTLSGARLGAGDLAATYPWMYVLPDGRVFCAGWEQGTWFLDTRGEGSWTPGPASHFGRRDFGSSVMYEPGKVLIVGGNPRDAAIPASLDPTARAEVIDLGVAQPAWREVAPMALPRRQLNTTLLPDGTVLATGGTSSPGFNDAARSAMTAEQWDPATGQWTTLAAMTVPRLYHSIALLLPDGRVLCAGGGFPPPTSGGVNRPDAEIFSPPYLFRGPRPVVTATPAVVSYGQAFPIDTPDASGIATVRWIRLSSVTHDYNQSQRSNVLAFSVVRGGLYATAPPDSNLCPPGHYLLFILNREGVPSLGRIVQVTRPATGAPVPGTRGLILAGARPNPAARGLTVAFALSGDAPAEITVFDPSGRRILTRDVSGLGPGEHVVDVGAATGLKPGVYMIRLTQAGQSVTKRAIVLQP